MNNKIRIGVVDVYPLFRQGVVQAIRRARDMAVVAEGESAADARGMALRCDVVLLEAAVPNSLAAVESILKESTSTKIVFLSAAQDDEHANKALQLGIHGYLMKEVTGSELIDALAAIHQGTRKIGSDLAWRLLTQSHAVVPKARQPLRLTVREQEVLDHTSRGLTNVQIADLLGISISSIKRHKAKIFRRMGVRNRIEAVIAAGSSRKPN